MPEPTAPSGGDYDEELQFGAVGKSFWPGAQDEDLECERPGMERWNQLKALSKRAVQLEAQAPSDELVQVARSCIEDASVEDMMQANKVFNFLWADEPEKSDLHDWPFGEYCLLGHVTALYVLAWGESTAGGDPSQVMSLLRKVNIPKSYGWL